MNGYMNSSTIYIAQEKDKVKGVLQWTKISHPADSHRVMWPLRRSGHAASFLPNHNALLIVGGEEKGNTLCDDSWVYEFGKQIWKKVLCHHNWRVK